LALREPVNLYSFYFFSGRVVYLVSTSVESIQYLLIVTIDASGIRLASSWTVDNLETIQIRGARRSERKQFSAASHFLGTNF
jgi:hypothetical protein